MLSCKLMRNALGLSATLLVLGAALILLVSRFVADAGSLSVAINALGIGSLLLAPAVLVGIVILAVMPGARKTLSLCDH